jgi:hypothetical protein
MEALNKWQKLSDHVPSPLRERDRVREKSLIIPLTLTLSPEVRGGEGTCSELP